MTAWIAKLEGELAKKDYRLIGMGHQLSQKISKKEGMHSELDNKSRGELPGLLVTSFLSLF